MIRLLTILVLIVALEGSRALAEEPSSRAVDIYSNGTRMAGDLWYPRALKPGERLPAIILVGGWGSTKDGNNRYYAPAFAKAGYIVLSFDFRGWAKSDSRLVLVGPEPKPDAEGFVTVKARAVRNIVDPIDRIEDAQAALDFLATEPSVDAARIGLWGTSYGGGTVVALAARDPRVRAVVAQIGSTNNEPYNTEEWRARMDVRAGEKARATILPLPMGVDTHPNLPGSFDAARLRFYLPVKDAEGVTAPTLVLDAAEDEYFDRRKNGLAVHEAIKARGVPTKYVAYENTTHYDIYKEPVRAKAMAEMLAWYGVHLDPQR